MTLVAAGARSVVDWTPIGLGRDLDGLAHVARETGLHVVAATGLHRDAHYTADDPLRTADVDELAERFAGELADRCGVIKAGASYHHLTRFEQKGFEAAAAAHVRSGAPVCVHTQHGTMGLAIVERLARARGAARVGDPRARRPQPRRGRACRDRSDRCDAPARRSRARQVLARLDDRAADRRPRRARARRPSAARRRHRAARDAARLRRRAGHGLRLRALPPAARARARRRAARADLRGESRPARSRGRRLLALPSRQLYSRLHGRAVQPGRPPRQSSPASSSGIGEAVARGVRRARAHGSPASHSTATRPSTASS